MAEVVSASISAFRTRTKHTVGRLVPIAYGSFFRLHCHVPLPRHRAIPDVQRVFAPHAATPPSTFILSRLQPDPSGKLSRANTPARNFYPAQSGSVSTSVPSVHYACLSATRRARSARQLGYVASARHSGGSRRGMCGNCRVSCMYAAALTTQFVSRQTMRAGGGVIGSVPAATSPAEK